MEHALGKWPKLESSIKKADSILLLLDLDGTLSPIVERPELVKMGETAVSVLEDFLANPKITVGIVSGRSIKDLKRLIPSSLKGIILAGNHGLEIAISDNYFVHSVALQTRPVLGRISKELKKEFQNFPGTLLEDKGLTLSVHYRLVEPERVVMAKSIFRKVTEPFVKDGKIRVSEGKKVLEVNPPVSWDKGKALNWIVETLKLSAALPIYAGDDQTDENAFQMLKDRGISIYVGRPTELSQAKYYLEDVQEIEELLRRLRGALSDDC